MPASLPIQVPARQVNKNLTKLKLGLLGEDLDDSNVTAVASRRQYSDDQHRIKLHHRNHHNHNHHHHISSSGSSSSTAGSSSPASKIHNHDEDDDLLEDDELRPHNHFDDLDDLDIEERPHFIKPRDLDDLDEFDVNLVGSTDREAARSYKQIEVDTNSFADDEDAGADDYDDDADTEEDDEDEVDEFLQQEYNENHYNHYPIDEFDEDPPRAEDNPMKLFESIQALARSLHKDSEIFGSLPPKRLLESPLRSLAFA